jgi:putative proteasome-type protease
VLTRIRHELTDNPECHICQARYMDEVADYIGAISREQQMRYMEAEGASAGFSPSVSFILGGQIRGEPPTLHLIYPEGNHITTSRATPYLQIGETKYGKPILDRVIDPETNLEDAARCALVSMDSTMRSNVTVGPPIELLLYKKDGYRLDHHLVLQAEDPYLLELKKMWDDKIKQAFNELPGFKPSLFKTETTER